jgi:hypothetical protein
MKTPKGMTEQETLAIIDKVIDRIKKKHVFSYFDLDDIKQEGRIIAIKALEKYDGIRPLENFMAVVLRTRLHNVKRDNYIRIDKPCLKCPLNAYIKNEDKCTAYDCKDSCELYKRWADKNNSRKNINNPIDISSARHDDEDNLMKETNLGVELDRNEFIDIIDEEISIETREYWLKFKAGMKLSRNKYEILLDEIRLILGEKYGEESW